MRRVPLLLLPLLVLISGCFCETLVTKVTWLQDEGRFRVERQVLNIQADGLECDSPESCTEKIKAFVQDPTAFDVVGGMAEDVAVVLSRRGAVLDATVSWVTPLGSNAAPGTNVFVEEEGKPGKERPHLLVLVGAAAADGTSPGAPIVIEGDVKKRHRVIWFADEDDSAPQRIEVWSLHPKVTEVTLRQTLTAGARPLFDQVPGLDAALVQAGLLPATP